MKKYGWLALLIAALDQAVKAYVRTMPLGYTYFEIPGLMELTHCVNSGAAFSILSGNAWLLTAVSIVLLGTIYMFAFRKMHLSIAARWAVACLFGGGAGNLLDRLLFAGVTDYIRLLFVDFPVFNLADIAITGSIAVLIVLLLTDTLEESLEGKHGSDH